MIKETAPRQVWTDEPLVSNKQVQKGSLLATDIHARKKK